MHGQQGQPAARLAGLGRKLIASARPRRRPGRARSEHLRLGRRSGPAALASAASRLRGRRPARRRSARAGTQPSGSSGSASRPGGQALDHAAERRPCRTASAVGAALGAGDGGLQHRPGGSSPQPFGESARAARPGLPSLSPSAICGAGQVEAGGHGLRIARGPRRRRSGAGAEPSPPSAITEDSPRASQRSARWRGAARRPSQARTRRGVVRGGFGQRQVAEGLGVVRPLGGGLAHHARPSRRA